jgi:hypothetical protein
MDSCSFDQVEVIVDGKDAPPPPGAKKLADRIT